jgi:hypothetical protein
LQRPKISKPIPHEALILEKEANWPGTKPAITEVIHSGLYYRLISEGP